MFDDLYLLKSKMNVRQRTEPECISSPILVNIEYLGLIVVHRVVRSHHWVLDFDSERTCNPRAL